MVRAVFSTQGTLVSSEENALVGLNDLMLINGSTEPVLYAVARGGGYITAFDVAGGPGYADVGHSWSIAQQFLQLESTDLVLRHGDTGPELYMVGLNSDDLRGVLIDDDGFGPLIDGNIATQTNGADPALFSDMALFSGQQNGIAALRSGGLISVSFGPGNSLNATAIDEGTQMKDARASDIVTATHNGQTYAFVSYGSADAVGMFRQLGDGTLQHIADLDAEDGLWMDNPGQLTVSTTTDGTLCVIIAASGSSSLTVLAVAEDGNAFYPVDQVLDTLDTRFDDASHVTSLTVDGHNFVLAAGSDGGLSVLTLLPGGRLQSVAHFEATADMPMSGVTAVEAMVMPGGISVWVSTEAAPYLSELYIDLPDLGVARKAQDDGGTLYGSALNDVLSGGAGDDSIVSGQGDDFLLDGGGADMLWGADGKDLFMFQTDSDIDTIMDFQLGSDQIDISAYAQLGEDNALSITSRSWGAEIRVGGDVIHVRTANATSLSAADFDETNLIRTGRVAMDPTPPNPTGSGPSDPPPGPQEPTDSTLTGEIPDAPTDIAAPLFEVKNGSNAVNGNDQANTMITNGTANLIFALGGNDTVISNGGQDSVDGGAGNDSIDGGHGDDLITGNVGADTIKGSGGEDTILGGSTADSLMGGSGSDVIVGDSGWDFLDGEGGHDSLWGGADADYILGGEGGDWLSGGANLMGKDRLLGEEGHDTLLGGIHEDHLEGGSGNDVLYGGMHADFVYGQDGDDIVLGGAGFDRLFGGDGNDKLYGGEGPSTDVLRGDAGNDTLWGGEGNDHLYGFADNDVVDGGHGNDYIMGGTGNDTLIGGAGDDTLFGNLNADVFVFHNDHGNDTIIDFLAHIPVEAIDLSNVTGLSTFADVLGAASQVGSDVLIATGSDSSVSLQDVNLNALSADDFIF